MSDLTPEQRAEALRLSGLFMRLRMAVDNLLFAEGSGVDDLEARADFNAALADLEQQLETYRAEARVKRLEEALREIGAPFSGFDPNLQNIARAALEEGAE